MESLTPQRLARPPAVQGSQPYSGRNVDNGNFITRSGKLGRTLRFRQGVHGRGVLKGTDAIATYFTIKGKDWSRDRFVGFARTPSDPDRRQLPRTRSFLPEPTPPAPWRSTSWRTPGRWRCLGPRPGFQAGSRSRYCDLRLGFSAAAWAATAHHAGPVPGRAAAARLVGDPGLPRGLRRAVLGLSA